MGKLFFKHYKEDGITQELFEVLYKNLKGYDEIVIINIGTDRCIGDCLSPLVGTMLKEKNFSINTYGTIKEPIHALNLEKRLNEIKTKHPNSFIVGIDACLGDEENIGQIQVRDIPIHPGKGVGKTLPDVGDISIIGIIDDSNNSSLFMNNSIRLDFIYDMAKIISESLMMLDQKYIEDKNKEVAASN